MITIITGTPGAGKTLYTIEKLLISLVGTSITYTNSEGEEVTAPRTIYTNINGLLLDHELIDGGDNQGLRDWYKWAKPGSVIVFDEVQRHWKPRANGSAVPPDIEALETHRHMGVDFILITQNVMLVDKNIHALAGRHLHVRRLATTHMAIVYEWDHVSRGLLYAKSLMKSPWRYSKKTFKLYKSAEVHTKQSRSIPGAVWFIVAALAGVSVFAPITYARLTERMSGKPAEQQAKTPSAGIGPRPAAPQQPASAPAAPTPQPPIAAASAPVFAGCMATRERCECFDTQGQKVEKDLGFCEIQMQPSKYKLAGGAFTDPAPLPAPEPPPKLVLKHEPEGITPAQLRAAYREHRAAFN